MPDIYLAAPYSARAAVRGNMQMLIAQGFTVSATWATGVFDGLPRGVAARQDLEEVKACSCLVADFTEGPSTSGGMHVEIGFALGLDIPVICVGERPEHAALLFLPSLDWVEHWRADALFTRLRAHCERGVLHA